MADTADGRVAGERVERTLERPDGRLVAWTETGDEHGQFVLRIPGAPASRQLLPVTWPVWQERRLRMVMTERPGYGISSPLPGHSVADHADDLAALLDTIGIDAAPMVAFGVGAVYLVAFAARHPDRVSAAAIVGGQGQVERSDLAEMIPVNRRSWTSILAGDRESLTRLLGSVRSEMLADPLGGAYSASADAPESDWRQIVKIDWQRRWMWDITEALRQGVDGWVDDSLAMGRGWRELDYSQITVPVRWYHARGDRNAPIAAARRVVARLPRGELVQWPLRDGSLVTPEHEAACLDDLIARHRRRTGQEPTAAG